VHARTHGTTCKKRFLRADVSMMAKRNPLLRPRYRLHNTLLRARCCALLAVAPLRACAPARSERTRASAAHARQRCARARACVALVRS
jgi:hypothetical protein